MGIMTREQAEKEIRDTFTEVYADGIIKALEQEPTTNNDLALINTWGLDEEIRCTMCTNSMKSDRGCDGSCVVNNDMYKAVMDAIEKRIQSTTKNDLGVDCISRQAVIDKAGLSEWFDSSDSYNEFVFALNELPSVTPIRPKGHWIHVMEGNALRVECSECHNREVNRSNFCPNCGADMREVVEE